ncbi:MAG TPA: phosphoribosyltransferase family protein [Gammaproteobacteria bacterium]|nr:phosphoribosyltransferase family protein [Gammaproteobacteria bacterium]
MHIQQKLTLIQNCGKMLFDETAIQKSILTMANQINQDLKGETIILLCILNGGLYTAYPLSRALKIHHQLECIKASRYQNNTSGAAPIIEHSTINFQNKTVLLVDDCIDQGVTLQAISQHCQDQGASKVLTAVLLNKTHLRPKNVPSPNYYSLISDTQHFVYGHGLDIHGYLRNLPNIFSIPGPMVHKIMSPATKT